MGKNSNNTSNSNLSNGAIIVIVLVGAGFAVLCGWAITRHFYTSDRSHEPNYLADGFSQAQYMRDVRLRNQEIIEAEAGYGGGRRYNGGGYGPEGGMNGGAPGGPKRPMVQQRETQMSNESSMY